MYQRSTIKKATAFFMAFFLLTVISLPAAAIVPERPENQYVLDTAGVLSEETEEKIIQENKQLFERTGAEIVVVAVDFLDGDEIEDYAYYLFNSWGIGSSQRNNGLLLLLAVAEDNYYAQAGYGIESYFNGSKLSDMLQTYLEPDFAKQEYDAGVQSFFDAALSEMETYYKDTSANAESFETGGKNYDTNYYDSYADEDAFLGGLSIGDIFRSVFGLVIRVIVIVIVVVVFVTVIRALFGSGGGPRGGSGGGGGRGFWTGMFLGNMMGRSYRRPPMGGPPFRGPRPPHGGFGGFSGGGRPGGGASRGGFSGGGGFTRGGGSRGGGAGRH